MEPSFDATVFTKNRRRLLRHKVERKLFEEVAYEADRRGLMSDEHFSVDGTLIEAAASIKSFSGELVATAYNLVRVSRLIAEREAKVPVFG